MHACTQSRSHTKWNRNAFCDVRLFSRVVRDKNSICFAQRAALILTWRRAGNWWRGVYPECSFFSPHNRNSHAYRGLRPQWLCRGVWMAAGSPDWAKYHRIGYFYRCYHYRLLRHQKAATHIHYIVRKITEKLHSKKITQYKLKSFPLTMDMATKCFHICSLSLVREAFNEELYQK